MSTLYCLYVIKFISYTIDHVFEYTPKWYTYLSSSIWYINIPKFLLGIKTEKKPFISNFYLERVAPRIKSINFPKSLSITHHQIPTWWTAKEKELLFLAEKWNRNFSFHIVLVDEILKDQCHYKIWTLGFLSLIFLTSKGKKRRKEKSLVSIVIPQIPTMDHLLWGVLRHCHLLWGHSFIITVTEDLCTKHCNPFSCVKKLMGMVIFWSK